MKLVRLCGWLLEESPEVVQRLERDTSKTMVLVHDQEKLSIPNMRLLVPSGILVYEIKGDYRSARQFFFSVQEGNGMNSAYLSVVEPAGRSLNFAKNVGTLFEYPWYSNEESSIIFERLAAGKRNAPLNGMLPHNPLDQYTPRSHPLAK
ncbi:MAG: hypothetical protein RL557_347 [archaeon]